MSLLKAAAITKLLLRRADGHVFLHKEDLWWESNSELVPVRADGVAEEVRHTLLNTSTHHCTSNFS